MAAIITSICKTLRIHFLSPQRTLFPRQIHLHGVDWDPVECTNDNEMAEMFESWCKKYGKKYSSEKEKAYRFSVFKDNYAQFILLNRHGDDGSGTSYCMGKFSDLRSEEVPTGYRRVPRHEL